LIALWRCLETGKIPWFANLARSQAMVWIGVQLLVFWLTVPALLAAAVLWDWRYLVLALVLQATHWAVGTFGVLLAEYLGWIAAKSMIETRGFVWAFTIHFAGNFSVYASWAMSRVIPA